MADVAADLNSWSATASSNQPTDATTIGSGLADNLQTIEAVVRGYLAAKGSDIASSANPDVAAVQGLYHDLTGTNTVTGLGSSATAGIWKILQFDSTPVLVHSTAMALPGAANITAAAGDVGIFFCEASNTWRCVSYVRASGNAVTQLAASDTVAGVIEYAIQSEQEAASSNTLAVTPGRQHFHPSAIKAAVRFNVAGTIAYNYNITSITDNGTGSWNVVIATDFSGAANYAAAGIIGARTGPNELILNVRNASAAGQFDIQAMSGGGTLADPSIDEVHIIFTGDFA